MLYETLRHACVAQLNAELMAYNPRYNLPRVGEVGETTFGVSTRLAVLDYQGRRKLPADGLVGPTTAYALLHDGAIPWTPTPARVPAAPRPSCPSSATTPSTIPC